MATDKKNQPDNTLVPLDERCSRVTEFVMQKDPDMNYDVVIFEECQKCKEYEPNFKFKSCRLDENIITIFFLSFFLIID